MSNALFGLWIVTAGFVLTLCAMDSTSQKAWANDLNGKKVAILVTDGFEQAELVEPRKALDEAGAKTFIVSPNKRQVQAWNKTDWGEKIGVDVPLDQAKADQFDALLLPGGVMNPDKLRTNPEAVQFVHSFFTAGKPVAAICHGPWMLVEAGVVKGRKLTSWPSVQTDIKNAGGEWVDSEVVVDRNMITSRKPDDIPAFNREILKVFGAATKGTATPPAKP